MFARRIIQVRFCSAKSSGRFVIDSESCSQNHRVEIASILVNLMSAESTGAVIAPQIIVSAVIDWVNNLQSQGKLAEAAQSLEEATLAARATPHEIEFVTRVQLGMTLAEVYVSSDRIGDARAFLREEVEFAQRMSQMMQKTGTLHQKRSTRSGYQQIRDRAQQIDLFGKPAPEIEIENWLIGEPTSVAKLLGKVVLIGFWATWSKPSQDMFPRLAALSNEYSTRGLEIIAMTRHYGRTAEARTAELELMRATIAEHAAPFSVAIAPDQGLQDRYGANGLPTIALIDRRGVVQYAGAGGDDPIFQERLQRCLDEGG